MKIPAGVPTSVLLAFALAGCSATPEAPEPPSGMDNPTFASLDIEDWPADADLRAGAPDAPAELDAATYDRLVAAIAGFAELSARADDLRALDDPIPELTARLDDPFARLIPLVAEQEISPRVTLLDYFGGGTEVTAGPLTQHVWDVRPADEGGTAITLQTWTAYEVTTDAGSGVIGVYREFQRTERENGFTSASWETSGTDTCALAVEDAMVLDNGADQLELLEAFAREGDEHVFAVREVEESITAEFRAECQDQG
jgi:hypothetical protein